MRKENLQRLNSIDFNRSDIYYLHYKSFHFELFNAIEKYASGDVLDIGCGNKPYEEKFSGFINSYIGCDIIQSSLQKVDIISPADNIPLGDSTFDTIISTQTIEHVGNYQGMIDEAFRLLKQDGVLILSGPFNWQIHEEPYDFFRFSRYGFELVLNNAGFEIVSIKENGGMWSVIGQLLLMNISNGHINRSRFMGIIFGFMKKKFCVTIINSFFDLLDRKDYNTINTINYVIVAKKNK